mmetsp:Transcript_74249/g.240142  ORF Transcript_74249/g.240142 Transcript_74249/m.240142 type:complete len:292 (-) Transcript_74249:407-1282(-)
MCVLSMELHRTTIVQLPWAQGANSSKVLRPATVAAGSGRYMGSASTTGARADALSRGELSGVAGQRCCGVAQLERPLAWLACRTKELSWTLPPPLPRDSQLRLRDEGPPHVEGVAAPVRPRPRPGDGAEVCRESAHEPTKGGSCHGRSAAAALPATRAGALCWRCNALVPSCLKGSTAPTAAVRCLEQCAARGCGMTCAAPPGSAEGQARCWCCRPLWKTSAVWRSSLEARWMSVMPLQMGSSRDSRRSSRAMRSLSPASCWATSLSGKRAGHGCTRRRGPWPGVSRCSGW